MYAHLIRFASCHTIHSVFTDPSLLPLSSQQFTIFPPHQSRSFVPPACAVVLFFAFLLVIHSFPFSRASQSFLPSVVSRSFLLSFWATHLANLVLVWKNAVVCFYFSFAVVPSFGKPVVPSSFIPSCPARPPPSSNPLGYGRLQVIRPVPLLNVRNLLMRLDFRHGSERP